MEISFEEILCSALQNNSCIHSDSVGCKCATHSFGDVGSPMAARAVERYNS